MQRSYARAVRGILLAVMAKVTSDRMKVPVDCKSWHNHSRNHNSSRNSNRKAVAWKKVSTHELLDAHLNHDTAIWCELLEEQGLAKVEAYGSPAKEWAHCGWYT